MTPPEKQRLALWQALLNTLLVQSGWRDDGASEFVAVMRALRADPSPEAGALHAKLEDLTPVDWNLLKSKIPARSKGRPKAVNRDDHIIALQMIEPVITNGRPVSEVASEFARQARGNSESNTALRLERTFRTVTGWKREPKEK